MDAGVSTARQTRAQHRHELRTLSYLTVDQENGGIVRNLNQYGLGAQMVAALRPGQRVRLRFELRYPKLRVEVRGEVVWGTFSGRCGIRFLDLPEALRRQLNEWILGDLLECISLHSDRAGEMFPAIVDVESAHSKGNRNGRNGAAHPVEEEDGLLISGAPSNVISLPLRHEPAGERARVTELSSEPGYLDWLSRPLSPQGVARTVDALTVFAALLLFALVFLSVTRESPPWPVAMIVGGAVLLALVYRGFYWVFGGESLGTRLARRVGLASRVSEKK